MRWIVSIGAVTVTECKLSWSFSSTLLDLDFPRHHVRFIGIHICHLSPCGRSCPPRRVVRKLLYFVMPGQYVRIKKHVGKICGSKHMAIIHACAFLATISSVLFKAPVTGFPSRTFEAYEALIQVGIDACWHAKCEWTRLSSFPTSNPTILPPVIGK